MKIVGFCVHGMGGQLTSGGMDKLAALLNRKTPRGVHFTVEGGLNPAPDTDALTARLISASDDGAIPMVFGHSLGGNFVWDFASRALKWRPRLKLPLLGSIDPVFWRTNGEKAGVWEIPRNVGTAMNWWQPFPPGGGKIVRAPGNRKSTLIEQRRNEPHTGFSIATAIDTAPDIHATILAAVLHVIQEGQQ